MIKYLVSMKGALNMKKPFFALLLTGVAISLSFAAANKLNRFEPKEAKAVADMGTYWNDWIENNASALATGGTTLVTALKSKITQIADGKDNPVSYNGLWKKFKSSDSIPGANGDYIWDTYGGYKYAYQSKGQSYSQEGDCYNREHSVPKSWFGEAKPAFSDLVHLMPTDGKVNETRSNYIFGEVENDTYQHTFPAQSHNGVQYQTAGKSKLGYAKAINGVTPSQSIVFEPDDQYKGDFARIYMYFAVRYGGGTCAATKSEGVAIFSSTFTNSNPYVTNYGRELLAKWHVQDPVSEKEEIRNDAIQEAQGNRNPFVDYPEWADKIFGSDYGPGVRISKKSATVYLNQTLQLTASASDGSDITWQTNNDAVAKVSTTGLVTARSVGKATITAKATIDGTEYSKSCEITVTEAPVLLTGISTAGQKTEFYVGDEFKYDGVCTAKYSNGTSKEVTPTVNSTSAKMDKPGTYPINLSYKDNNITKQTSYNITVVEKPADDSSGDNQDQDKGQQNQSGLQPWAIGLIIGGGVAVTAGIAIAIVLIVKKKH